MVMFGGSEALSVLPLRFCEIHVGVDGALFLGRFSFSSFFPFSFLMSVCGPLPLPPVVPCVFEE